MMDPAGQPQSAVLAAVVADFIALDNHPYAGALARRYFHHVAEEELASRPASILAGALKSHLDLARERRPGSAAVRVFNPSTEVDGWSSSRTVIQVVTDDMPFLVDSVSGQLSRRDIDIHFVVHPQIGAVRSSSGELIDVVELTDALDPAVAENARSEVLAESWIMMTIDRQSGSDLGGGLAEDLLQVLADVRKAVDDWPKMRTKALVIAAELEGTPPPGVDRDEVQQAAAFLRWMADNHFTFLGYREYVIGDSVLAADGGAQPLITAVPDSGLGILRPSSAEDQPASRAKAESSAVAGSSKVLILTKANSLSTVHRPTPLDYVGISRYSAAGETVGEMRFVGLYASTAYTESVLRLPVVAEKVTQVLSRSGLTPDSHTGKDLLDILETYPRDELIQASVDQIFDTAMSVAQLQGRRRTKLFLREDDFGRFISALVYIPRDRYNTTVRTRMSAILQDAFGGESVEFTARVSESALSRLHFVVRVPTGTRVATLTSEQRDALERDLVEVSRTWTDRLGDRVRERLGEGEGNRVLDRFGRGFPTGYAETFTTVQGVADLEHLDRLSATHPTSVALYRPNGSTEDSRRFKLFRIDPLSLTHVLPIFTDMGVEVVDEQPYVISRADQTQLYVYDFGLRVADANTWNRYTHDELRRLFESAVLAVWDERAESDGFNKLVLTAGLTWRQVIIVRAIAKYLRQAQSSFSQQYVEDALVANPGIASDLVAYFEARFDPDLFAGEANSEREARVQEIIDRITAGLDEVSSLDQDRIIQSLLTVMQACLRTNFYQRTGGSDEPKSYVSFKLNPRAIPDLPAPRPAYEIWVYSPRVEGVHLRFGAVARGGLRWSDRREDFRTEVLGLVKAQMVKNAVIVPTGSKGGFYAKRLPDPSADRSAWLDEGVAAYRIFISGLLDITDNRDGTEITPPVRVVRHDASDPYLVVAADKGTATFSDIANGLARDYGFWLDDAFASGGSTGYDHKAMGITARGAWESVKRHFAELGLDTQTEDFTVVGVGDMSGDVFGNGMLLSEHIRLVAAFDHRHIFIDPQPDPAISYAERRRLFDLPRSSWADYDPALISAGGGVYARTMKSVSISEPVRAALGLGSAITALTPAELIRAILLAPVDLLWNGGIGTYVKASSEDNLAIGDRANDAVRVDGNQLSVRVVGEGGNLGLSQLGRIEAAQSGVRLNTDAIDNSAGVGTSDHEVNIKILLGEVVRRGDLTMDERNTLLASMTDEVAAHVLRDNYEQNVVLGNARAQEHSMAPVHVRFMDWLDERGVLDRGLEFLPSDNEMARRASESAGLTSPELSVLVAYAKLTLKTDLITTELADDPYFESVLADYFPTALRESYAAELGAHPLRREIIINSVVNSMINHGGITCVFRAGEEAAGTPEQVARAFVVCGEIFGLRDFVERVEALDHQVGTQVQTELYLEFRRLIDRAVRWMLAARPGGIDISGEIAKFGDTIAVLGPQVAQMQRGYEHKDLIERAQAWVEAGVPQDLATWAASLLDRYSLLDVVNLATELRQQPASVAQAYFAMSDRFDIESILAKIARLPRDDRWDALARGALRQDVYAVLESLTRQEREFSAAQDQRSASEADQDTLNEQLEAWAQSRAEVISRAGGQVSAVLALERPNIAALSVALRALRGITREPVG